MENSRYIVFDPVSNWYKNNKNNTTKRVFEQDGYKNRSWWNNKIAELIALGYKEVDDATGGDHDYIVYDTKRKEWCWWENGFCPFCCNPKEFPKDKNLNYWSECRT